MSSKLIGADAEFFSKMVVDAANAIKVIPAAKEEQIFGGRSTWKVQVTA